MTENEAIGRIQSGICCEKGAVRYCTDACMHGKEKCAYSMAINALEEVRQYRAIGTVEECRDAVEKQKPKKPIEHRYNNPIARFINGDVKTYYNCPNCNALYVERDKTCYKCGQMLNLSDFRDVVWNRRENDGKTD